MKQLRIDFLNSKMAQAVREKVLNSFKSGKTQFLITTDVVNRGIDIPNLNYVLNYDFPTNLVTYISLPPSCCLLHTTSIASAARVATTRRVTRAVSSHAICRRWCRTWCASCRRTVGERRGREAQSRRCRSC